MRQKIFYKIILSLSALFFSFSSVNQAQDWSLNLSIDPYPSPYLSNWQNDPTLAYLEIQNNTNEQDVVIIDLEVIDGSGNLILKAYSRNLLFLPDEPVMMNTTDFGDWNVPFIQNSVQDKIARTGMIPEGDYDICVSIRNLWGEELVTETCGYTFITHPEPPELIFPVDYEVVYMEYPVFQWIPPQLASGQMVYLFRLVEVMQGQIPERAIETNYPHYENFNIFESDFEYPLEGLPLEPGKTYAWQVQAVDFEGRPATKNEGKSIVGIFKMPDASDGIFSQLELIAPEDEALLTTNYPTFEWLEPLSSTGEQLQYNLLISQVNTGQTAENAIKNNLLFYINENPIYETTFSYPLSAPLLEKDKTYAWQVEALDPFGNAAAASEGLSEVRTFTITGEEEVEPVIADLLPERLPVLDESAAYIQLKQGGVGLVDYSSSPGSNSITVTGDMSLYLPAMASSDIPEISVSGEITFNNETLEIEAGSFSGNIPADENSILNLSGKGVPLVISSISYNALNHNIINCTASPFIFGTVLSSTNIPCIIEYNGELKADFFSPCNNSFSVAGSNKLVYQLNTLRGNINGIPSSGIAQTNLTAEGNLILSEGNQRIEMPVNLALDETGASSLNSPNNAGSITLNLNSVSLLLSGIGCGSLNYSNSQNSWSFDLGFDLTIRFNDLNITLPDVADVHMSKFGIEIPEISLTNLNISNYQSYGDVSIRPAAFRMYSYVFDWLNYSGGDIGDWGLFFDLDIRLSQLPQRMSAINEAPLRANNAIYKNGLFTGNWNARTFASPIFCSVSDNHSWGFNIHQIKGAFESSSRGVKIGLNADLVPPAGLNMNPGETITFDDTQLQLSTRGIFTGNLDALALNNPVLWSDDLKIQSQTSSLIFNELNGAQSSLLNIAGVIDIRTLDQSIIKAAGQGIFDLMEWNLKSGEFRVEDPFVLGLPPSSPLLSIECSPGALLNQSGLHVSPQTGNAILSSGGRVDCGYENIIDIKLPSWEIQSGTIQFNETFALNLQDWQRGTDNMKWESLPANQNVQSNNDNLYLQLPGLNLPRIDGNALITYGGSSAVLQYNGERHEMNSTFSNDFMFAVSSKSVTRGKVEFSIAGEQVALLDASGFHLGQYFSGVIAGMKIGLPDTTVAYIDMSENSHLQITSENGLTRIKSQPNQKATIRFAALKYNNSTDPSFQADIDLTIDPAAYNITTAKVKAEGDPALSLVPGNVPLEMTLLEFDGQNWTASVKPYLPSALRDNNLITEGIVIGSSGLGSFEDGYNLIAGSPQDSVKLGDYLTVTLDGIRCVAGGQIPLIKLSGDFISPVFNSSGIHFTSDLYTDKAEFDLYTLNTELTIGCSTLSLFDQNDLPKVEAQMTEDKLAVILCGELKLNNLSNGFNLTLPRLELSGSEFKLAPLSQQGNQQQLKIYGTDFTFDDFDITFSLNGFDLILDGSMKLFGKEIDVKGLHIKNDCSIADTTLAQKNNGFRINSLISINKLAAQSGKLKIEGNINLPDPFDQNLKREFALNIGGDGSWLADDLSKLNEKNFSFEIASDERPVIKLGDNNFNINAGLTGIDLSMNGNDNSKLDGSLDYQVDTYWPQENLIGTGDSATIATIGKFIFDESNLSSAWALSETVTDTITTVLDSDMFMHAATFSMADTAGYKIEFNSLLQLPLPSDIVNGQVELTGNKLEPGQFNFGNLHTAQVYIAGITLELLDFHFVRDGMVESSEIEFSETKSSVVSKTYHADLYFSFGANLSTDLPGFAAGVDRLVIFKNDDQFHLLIDNANLWVGDFISGSLDIVGSIWQNDSGPLFRWLLGGHLNMKMGQVEGITVVGEVSYKEIIGLDNQVHKHPGFGLFIAVNTDIDLTPLPISVKGAGAGFFWNPSPEIRDMVRGHLGFSEDISDPFKEIMEARDDDMITLWEFYLYGAAAIPDDNYISAKALLTLATDRIALDAKAWPADSTAIKKVVNLTGWLTAECAWAQDFGSFKYLAGHIKVGGGSTESVGILSLPQTASTALDFIVTGQGQFAMAGYIDMSALNSSILAAECDFTFGNPGFVFNGGVSRSFNIAQVISFGGGLDMSFYVKWVEPKRLGAYASAWVEGYVLDEWLAGFRGELGAALMIMPDIFLYGYAELEGTILGVSKTIRAWAKWEKDGGVSAGTGTDDTMQQIIADAQQTAEDIMTAVQDLKAEMDMIEPGGLSDEEIRALIESMESGMADNYYSLYTQDVEEVKEVYSDIRDDIQGDDQRKLDLFINDITETGKLHPTSWTNNISALDNEIESMEPVLDQIKSELTNRNQSFKTSCDQLANELNSIDFALDTLTALMNVGESPIQNPLDLSYGLLEGIRTPNINVDNQQVERNAENAAKLQQAFEEWLTRAERNIQKILKGRKEVFSNIGPGGKSSLMHEQVQAPVLGGNSDFQSNIENLNHDFQDLYNSYNSITLMSISDAALSRLAYSSSHREMSIARRSSALALLGISSEHLPANEIDRYRVLGDKFYRVIPQVMMQNRIQLADSIMIGFTKYYKNLQSDLDRQHQILTSYTDALWDKYAELSEKIYTILDLYKSYVDDLPAGNESLTLSDSADAILSRIENEFAFPAVSASMNVSSTDGFAPVTVTLDCGGNQSAGISEFAVSFNDNPFQSLGSSSILIRESMLKHGVSYWYENNLGERTIPRVATETSSLKISPRYRNYAGLTTNSNPFTVQLNGKSWYYGNASNEIESTPMPDSIYSCNVFYPYPMAGSNSTDKFYYCGRTNSITLMWKLENTYGTIGGYAPLPAKHVVELKQGNTTIFGPEAFPVTNTAMPDTFSVNISGLNLEADTGVPVIATVTAYNIEDKVIGTSTGSHTVHFQRADNSTGSIEKTWQPPPLYIDTTPPKITGSEKVKQAEGRPVVYSFPKAKEFVKKGNTNFIVKMINGYTNYEYQLLSWNETPGENNWQTMEGSELVENLTETNLYGDPYPDMMNGNYTAYCLKLGRLPYTDSIKVAVRAKNNHPNWATGYSDIAFYSIPKIECFSIPVPAQFEIVELDENNNMVIEIAEAGSDSVSGIKQYGGAFEQDLIPSSPGIVIKYPESVKFSKDEITKNARIKIPVPLDSIDVNNDLRVVLFSENNSGYTSSSFKDYKPNPPAPEFNFKIEEGMKPFTLIAEGLLGLLSGNHINKVQLRIGTLPDSADIGSYQKSFSALYNMGAWREESRIFRWLIDLPESIDYGTSLYLWAKNIRGELSSEWTRQRVQIYPQMFTTVETDEEGYLVLPITKAAFNGTKEASFEWAVGGISSQGECYFNIRPYTSLDGITASDVTEGARLRLPIKAGDVRPRSLISLRATALDGETSATYIDTEIIPPKPNVTGELRIKELQHNAIVYELLLNTSIGTLMQDGSKVELKIGTEAGAADLFSEIKNVASPSQSASTQVTIIMPDSISVFNKIYASAKSISRNGLVSKDSTLISFDMIYPDEFCGNPQILFTGEIGVKAIRHAVSNSENISGYKFAIGDGDSFNLRGYPSGIDIQTSDWKPGEVVTLPFNVTQATSATSIRVGVQAVMIDGTVKENILNTESFIKPEVDVTVIERFPYNNLLHVKGSFDAETVARISTGRLEIALYIGDQKYVGRNLYVPDNGIFNKKFSLQSDLPKCTTYTFACWFWDNVIGTIAKWETDLWMPGDPMFYQAGADDEDMIYVDIVREGFHGDAALSGYQFALGSSRGSDDIRLFPAAGNYDFSPGEVKPDQRLTLPHSLAGCPSTTYVTLRAINSEGEIHETSESFNARPAMPKVISLSMDNSGNFKAEFDVSRVDDKVNSIDIWIRDEEDSGSHTIAFENITKLRIETGTVEFDSNFTEADLNRNFVLEGLHLGYQINSLQFVYKFKIEKAGNDYQIVPLN